MSPLKKDSSSTGSTGPENRGRPTAAPSSRVTFRYLALAVFITLFVSLAVGSFSTAPSLAVDRTYDEIETFANVLSLIQANYVDEVEPHKVIEGAINGMLRTLDPHSSYMTPELFKEMQVDTQGEFGGLGIEITIDEGWLTVVSPMEETPAWKAGIKAGDKIVKVDGTLTRDMSLMESVRMMRGKRGTPVTIAIMREGFDEPKDFTIVRDIIHVASVKSDLLPDDIGYVRIRSFTKDAGKEMRSAIAKLEGKGMKALVLDLRNDPGGLLDQAVSVSEYFLKKGELIVYTKGRLENQNMSFKAENVRRGAPFPMVVLVNEGSASASEIVAGAMQDLKRAVIVGVQSFGKGSVQTIIPLKGNAGLRLTTARYYTPSGRQIQGVGITPDIVVEQAPPSVVADGKGNGRHRLREKDLPNSLAPAKSKKTSTKSNEKKSLKRPTTDLARDVQLQRAVAVLKSWKIIQNVQSR